MMFFGFPFPGFEGLGPDRGQQSGDEDAHALGTLNGAPAASDAEVRQQLLATLYEAKEMRAEVVAAYDNGAGGASSARALAVIAEADRALRGLTRDLMGLSPETVAALTPIVQGIVSECTRVINNMHDPDDALVPPLVEFAAHAGRIFRTSFITQGDLTYDGRRGEAIEAARQALEGARGGLGFELDRRRAEWHVGDEARDLGGDGIIHDLAAAAGALRDAQPDSRKQLQPLATEVAGLILDLRQYAPPAGRTHEVMVRGSDVLQLVGMPQRLDAATMQDILKSEAISGRGYSDQQLADFEAAAGELEVVQEYVFESQMLGVRTIEREAQEKDPPKPKPWWQELAVELAFAALSAVTMGIGGKIAEKVAGKIGGVLEKGLELFRETRVKIEHIVTDGMKEALKFGFAKAKGAILAHEGGGGASSYLKVAFFSGQDRTLIEAKRSEGMKTVKAVREERAALALAPEAGIVSLKALVAAAREAAAEAETAQTAETAAKYATLLANAALGQKDIGGGETVTDIGKANEVEAGNMGVENEDNYDGLVSLEAIIPSDTRPDAPVKVTSAWVKGLNEGLRKRILEMKIGEMQMPVRLRVVPHFARQSLVVQPYVSMASDGAGKVKESHNDGGEAWLTWRGMAKKITSAEWVARQILEQDIGAVPLKDQVKSLDG